MKLFYIFLGVAFLSLAGVSFYYTNIRKEDATFNASQGTSQTESIYIYREYGDVAFKSKSATEYTAVGDIKMTIDNHATVKTGDGRGQIIFPDNSSISLSTSTEIEINYEPTKISIMQILGTTYHRVTSLATGNKYEVRTPNTLAAVRGTKFAVTYSPKLKKTYVVVTEHKVEVTQTKEDGVVTKAPVMVQEGSLADVQSSTSTVISTSSPRINEKMIIRTNDEVKDLKSFIEENKIIDKEYDNTPLDKRKEFLEKIIDSLQKDSKKQPEQSGGTSDASGKPPITRAETLKRIITQATLTPEDTPLRTTTVQEESAPKIIPTTATTTPAKITPTTSIVTPTKTLTDLPVDAEKFTPEEDVFVDSFYTAYEKYFFVDDPRAYCTRLGTTQAKDMVMALIAIANRAGFKIPNQPDISLFATDLVAACADGSITSKAAAFRTQFDTVYPY